MVAPIKEMKCKIVGSAGTFGISCTAKNLGIPLVNLSTAYVLSGSVIGTWKIDDKTHPTSKYGLSKLLGDHEILSMYPSKSYILLTVWLYRNYGKNFAKTVLNKALTEKDVIRAVYNQKAQPISTIELANRVPNLVDAKTSTDIHRANNTGKESWWKLTKQLVSLAGKSELRVIPVTPKKCISPGKYPSNLVLAHSEWDNVGMDPISNLRESLSKFFPSPLSNAKEEIARG